MKKILFLIFFAFISFSLFAGLSYELYTNNVKLNWDKVDNAVYYDIYVGTKPLVRLTKGELTYTVKNLDQNSDYTITMGARDENNNTLYAAKVSFTTLDYSGIYRFENSSEDDNDGKLDSLEFKASLIEDERGQYMSISYPIDGKYLQFFPFEPFNGPWNWIKFKSNLDIAKVYKDICRKINVLDITPSEFKPDNVSLTTDSVILDITSKAFGIKVSTKTELLFKSDETGTYLIFKTDGSDLAKKALYNNKSSSDPYAFRLEKVN